jgi:D-3-phosphoglycerate dehydrogenase
MSETVEALILDLLEWLHLRERSYAETIDAWRTSCPRLPVWEDANEHGFVITTQHNGRLCVLVTPAGVDYICRQRPAIAVG